MVVTRNWRGQCRSVGKRCKLPVIIGVSSEALILNMVTKVNDIVYLKVAKRMSSMLLHKIIVIMRRYRCLLNLLW